MHLTELQSLAKQRPIDIAIVSVKSYDTEWATTMIRQYLAPGGYVVSLQNCINEERIAGDRRLGPRGRRHRRDHLGRSVRRPGTSVAPCRRAAPRIPCSASARCMAA